MQKPFQRRKQPVAIFYSYASQDEQLFRELQKQLALLRQQYGISEWDRSQIKAGTDWHREIDDQLERASIILLLISADFLNSSACYREMLRALERERRGDARVIPIILRPVDWTGSLFAHLHCLPANKQPVTQWSNQDAAFKEIASGVRTSVEALLRQPVEDFIDEEEIKPADPTENRTWPRYVAKKVRDHATVFVILSLILAVACVGGGVFASLASSQTGSSSSPLDPNKLNALSDGRFIFDTTQMPVLWKDDAKREFRDNRIDTAIADWKMAIDENPTDAESRIYWQDQQIIQAHQPYVTVVALVNLVPDADYAQPGRARDMLQGLALAQDEFNNVHNDLKIRVLIANVSTLQQSPLFDAALDAVVQQILMAYTKNVYQNIVGVVGWPFNGKKNELTQLTRVLAVISSIAPAKDLPGTPSFFSVAPSLKAEAQAARRYINAKWPGEPILLLEDFSDPYSRQLGDAFVQASGNNAPVRYYTIGQICHAVGVCSALNPFLSNNMVIYFAGYPGDAHFILDKTRAFQNINVIGGDVLSQLVNTPTQYGGAFNYLYYTAFAFHAIAHDQNFPQDPQQNFTEDYKRLFNAQRASPLCGYTCIIASNDTILAYDATLVLAQTALKARKGSTSPLASDVQGVLGGSGFTPIQGASGLLAFARDGTLARDNAVILFQMDEKAHTQIRWR